MECQLVTVHPDILHVCTRGQCLCQGGQLAAQFFAHGEKCAVLDHLCAIDYCSMAALRIDYQHSFWPVQLFQELPAKDLGKDKRREK